jgi:hypothetical protein
MNRFSPDLSILFVNSSEASPVKLSRVLISIHDSRMYAKFLQHAPQPLQTWGDDPLAVLSDVNRILFLQAIVSGSPRGSLRRR